MLSDKELIKRYCEGDAEAMGELYQRYRGLVAAMVWRACRRKDADVCQDVWVEVCKRAGKYNAERGPVALWLVMVARSTILAHLNTLHGHPGRSRSAARFIRPAMLTGQYTTSDDETVSVLDQIASPDRPPLDVLIWQEEIDRIRGFSLSRLSDRTWDVAEGMLNGDTVAESQRATGLTRNQVKGRREHALKKMRRMGRAA